MPVPAMTELEVDHQRRFQAAVDVIHNLPKNGSYRPGYDVMLRFYSLYKQAICGPCTVPRPGFWDPIGRYKWDAWSRLGEMSRENAMAAYVEEIKKVAQEVIDTMPMNETTASLFHHFEPLYVVIDDMPRPPASLLALRDTQCTDSPAVTNDEDKEGGSTENPESIDPNNEQNLSKVDDSTDCRINNELVQQTNPADYRLSEVLVLTSDSESEIFCDSVDSVEQLSNIKVPVVKTNGFQNGHVTLQSSPNRLEVGMEGRQVGAGGGGEGGEGAEDRKGQGPLRRNRDLGREGPYNSWRERGVPQGSPRWGAPGGGGGGARRGGDGSEGGAESLHDTHLQQQIILALRRLREDMRSVMVRLEAVERLAATQTSEWRPCLQCSATPQQEENWWPLDVSPSTVFLFLLWPFVAQGVVHLLRKAHLRTRMSS